MWKEFSEEFWVKKIEFINAIVEDKVSLIRQRTFLRTYRRKDGADTVKYVERLRDQKNDKFNWNKKT